MFDLRDLFFTCVTYFPKKVKTLFDLCTVNRHGPKLEVLFFKEKWSGKILGDGSSDITRGVGPLKKGAEAAKKLFLKRLGVCVTSAYAKVFPL